MTSQAPCIYDLMLSNHSWSNFYFANTLLPFLITMKSLTGINTLALSSETLLKAKFQSSAVNESRKD